MADLYRRTGLFRLIIPASGQASNAVDLGGYAVFGLISPNAWTAADLSLQVSVDNQTYVDLYTDAGAQAKLLSSNIPTSGSRAFGLDNFAAAVAPWRYLRVVSSVAQAAERVWTLVAKG